jgi:hypothetical protein
MTHGTPTDGRHGQVLILVAAAMVVLIGIAALVVDLGMSWMIHRQEQNGVDPAAVAAARYINEDGSIDMAMATSAACFYARENGLFDPTNASCSTAGDPNKTTLTVNYPPDASAGPGYMGRPYYVQVKISREHPVFFGRLFGTSFATVTTSAVAANTKGSSNSNSLVALDPTTCASGVVTGGASVSITPTVDPSTGLPYDGGYVQVNSGCGSGATDNVCGVGEGNKALAITGSGSNLTAPHVFVHGTCSRANNNSFSSPLTEGAVQVGDPLAQLQPPRIADFTPGRCGPSGIVTSPTGANSHGCNFNTAGTYLLDPGVYYGGWSIGNNVTLQLNPGIYIMAGGGVSLQAGGSISSITDALGNPAPIMVFSTDNPAASCPGGASYQCQGSIDFTASSTLKVRGLNETPCPPVSSTGCPYNGILLWQDGSGSNPSKPVTLGGQTTLDISGTIYAPKALVTLTGGSTGSGIAAVQIIAWQWNLGGGAVLTMPYDPARLYRPQDKGLVR